MLSDLDTKLSSLSATESPDDERQLAILREQIELWRGDQRTPAQWIEVLRRGLGGVWLSTDELHQAIHESLEAFGATVEGLRGMTMNERLVVFGLMERWDECDESGRKDLYRKLEARTD